MENNSMNSINNSKSKVVSSSNNSERTVSDGDLEESGWTTYFDDFFNKQNTEDSCCSSVLESSLISDAAFSAVRYDKVADNGQFMGFSQEKGCDRLSFKKKKTKVFVVDDDLEDTASSPAHRPKICNIMSEYLDKRPDHNNTLDISKEKGSSSSARQVEQRSGDDSINGKDNETELKKRGLCLVPLSMIVDYLG